MHENCNETPLQVAAATAAAEPSSASKGQKKIKAKNDNPNVWKFHDLHMKLYMYF